MSLNHPKRPTNGALVHICSLEPFNHNSDDVQFCQKILCACGIKMRLTLNGKTALFSRRYISHIHFFPLFSNHKNLGAHLFVRQKFHEEYLFFFVFVSQNFVCKPYRYICLTHTPNEVRKNFNYIAGKWIKFQQFYRYFIWIASDF